MQGEAPGSKGTETPVLPAVFAEPAGRGDLAPALLSTLRALPHSEPGARPHALFPRPPLEWTLSAGQSPDPESLGQGWTHSVGMYLPRGGGGPLSCWPVPEPPDSGADVGLCRHLHHPCACLDLSRPWERSPCAMQGKALGSKGTEKVLF